jgi:hypothetical protein
MKTALFALLSFTLFGNLVAAGDGARAVRAPGSASLRSRRARDVDEDGVGEVAAKTETVTRELPPEFIAHCQSIGAEMIPVADTGSMEPLFTGKTVLGIKPVAFHRIKKGDILVFERRGKLVVHRAVDLYLGEWVVRGDALKANDADTVKAKDIRGRVVTFYNCQ